MSSTSIIDGLRDNLKSANDALTAAEEKLKAANDHLNEKEKRLAEETVKADTLLGKKQIEHCP